MTQTNRPPENPGRFNPLNFPYRRGDCRLPKSVACMSRLTQVPFVFDPSVDDEKSSYLMFEGVEGGQHVTWPSIGESLFVPTHNYYPDLDAVERDNGERFATHGRSGFSVGRYHEFLIDPVQYNVFDWDMAHFRVKIGTTAEASFGYATPLMAFLFEGPRPRWVEWSDQPTVRILGPDRDGVEAVLVSAFRAYHRNVGKWPTVFDLEALKEDEEVNSKTASDRVDPVMLGADLEPLRFLHAAMTQSDGTAACVYLYRIIEYYAFFNNLGKLSNLRHDASLSDTDFSRHMVETMFRDEKGPIQRLVQMLADRPLLDAAFNLGIVNSPSPSHLSTALYVFRNSIVHGKYGSGFAMHSDPVIGARGVSSKWRPILLELANRSIDHFGARN
ncbi:hypothetical protein LCGC14_0902830 [marine sediment metagenome]|uniref:Uncharacterized protein n=1 Tax=marine sediment metagenome TaxID=412755 RepID=A0A0F9S2S2_9ZZZZ